ncbi:MAG: citrate synthase [bacterium]|nr:citrate synthase [bacterium]
MANLQLSKNACQLLLDGETYEMPVYVGSENEKAVDITQLRAKTGYITLDSGYANTGSCVSSITYIDGEKGILRYRGIPIEQLAQKSTFVETAYLIIYGELPNREQLKRFSNLLTQHEMIHETLKHHFEGFPPTAHPMAILSAMINAMGCFQPDPMGTGDQFDDTVARLLSKVRTIAAFSYKKSIGQPFIYPNPDFSYCANLLHMMFSVPYREFGPDPDVVAAMNLILILHADHEQNCSTSTVRMVGSSQANLFASVASGVCALWGPRHGGANQAVISMLEEIIKSKMDVQEYIRRVKDSKNEIKLMGFGHRVYKSYDPRATILRQTCEKLLAKLGIKDPALDVAKGLETAALSDEYFISRHLYPNVDFYSGIIMRAIGIPLNMFTVMFAIGRMPGWIANWREVNDDPKGRIYRPRQIYTGPTIRDYVSVEQR